MEECSGVMIPDSNPNNASYILYDNNLDSWKIYDLEEANKRIPPESTYKIYDALLGLESGIIR